MQRVAGDFNPSLELLLYRDRFQLATGDALYSDGDRYIPAVTAVKKVESLLPSMRNALVLGTGLGSIVDVLYKKKCTPGITLVEKDNIVLGLAMELMAGRSSCNLTPVCADAEAFMAANRQKYDFIFVDIFSGRVVPPFVCTPQFMAQCQDGLSDAGCVAFNYIVNNDEEWAEVRSMFTRMFRRCEIASVGVNRILIGWKN